MLNSVSSASSHIHVHHYSLIHDCHLFQVERYTISGLHTSPVTAIEWSMNGMKMFSGDKSGLVVLTEIDFYMVSICNIMNDVCTVQVLG